MAYCLGALILVLLSVSLTSATTCTNSYACGTGMCCRAADGTVVSDREMGGFGGPFNHFGGEGGALNGTCSARKAQKGEVCDSNCVCDAGLACYRPMSGVCCPQMTCYDEAYVHQQQAYWSKCLSDPNCPIPP